MRKLGLLIILFIVSKLIYASSFLPAFEAFKIQISTESTAALWLHFDIAPEYHLYQDKIKILPLADNQVKLASPQWPDTITLKAKGIGSYQVFKGNTNIRVPILKLGNGHLAIKVQYQGCKGLDLCYPGEEALFTTNLKTNNKLISPQNTASTSTTLSNNNPAIKVTGYLMTIGGFFLLGLLIAFTPCVFPMLPVLIGVITGSSGKIKQSFSLALSYIIGSAVFYALIGLIAVSLGINLTILFQLTWLNWILASLFILLGFSLILNFNLSAFNALSTNINRIVSRHNKHTIGSSFIIGALSSLILSPCASAPLASSLAYIATTHNYLLGASSLFALGLGSGVPLLIIAVFGRHYLPKSGTWMVLVKNIIALLMLAAGLFILAKVVDLKFLIVGGALFIVLASYLLLKPLSLLGKYRQLLGVLIGIILALIWYQQANNRLSLNYYDYNINNLTQLDSVLQKESNRLIILDFYASWCFACHELELTTLQDTQIRNQLKNYTFIRVNLSANDQNSQELIQKYQIIAPPTLIIIKNGQIKNKIVGFINAKELGLLLESKI